MAGKIPISYYQISPTVIQDDSFDVVIGRLILSINADKKKPQYLEQSVKPIFNKDYEVRLFHATKPAPPHWQGFIREIAESQSTILTCMITGQSFLMFVGYKSRIFAITGGSGSYAIEGYTSGTFGVDIITRIIEKDSPVIKSLQYRGLTGTLLAQTKHFRSESRLSDENQFGQIYKKVNADLDHQILTSVFGFKASELKKELAGCTAKASFKINKSLDLQAFLRVIANFDTILNKSPKFAINSIERLEKKKALHLIGKLEHAFREKLYEDYLNKLNPDVDFIHRELEKYKQATYYRLYFEGGHYDFDDEPSLFQIQTILQRKGSLISNNVFEYKCSVLDLMLESLDEDGTILTQGKVSNHIHGEVFFEGRSYFLIEGEWYLVGNKFKEDLNAGLQAVIPHYINDVLITKPFSTKMEEGDWNLSFIGNPEILVLDTVTPNGIEMCDLLKIENEKLYLIHVKKGFNSSMRELASQVSIAARRIKQDILSDFAYINRVEKSIKQMAKSSSNKKQQLATQQFPINGLSSLFKGKTIKDICFCLAFVDTNDTTKLLKDSVSSYKSSIAKYSLIELIDQINFLGFDFKIIQLKEANGDTISNTSKVA